MNIVSKFERDLYKNYLILELDESIDERAHQLQMILNNKIQGLLDTELRIIDMKTNMYYDITSKQTLSQLLSKGEINHKQLRDIIQGIITALKISRSYLLNDLNFILEPEYIYIEPSKYEISLCYYPHQAQTDVLCKLEKLVEFLMHKVKSNDESAVMLIYNLFKLVKEKNYSLDVLEQTLYTYQQIATSSTDIEDIKSIKKIDKIDNQLTKKVNIPVVNNRVYDNKEIETYSYQTLALSSAVGLIALIVLIYINTSNLFIDRTTGLRDVVKSGGLSVIVLAIVAYALLKLLDKKNKVTKIIKEEKYIEEVQVIENNYHEDELIEEEGATTILTTVKVQEHKPYLVNKDGSYSKCIDEFPFIIGKLSNNVDLLISKETVSRIHAQLDKQDNRYYITDLNSKNGTYLNSQRILGNSRKEVKKGDTLSFADEIYTFTIK